MKYCTFYTEGFYEEVAQSYIIPSAHCHGIDLYKIKIPSTHDWRKNTEFKANMILRALEETKDDIVMIDADATFEQYPFLFDKLDLTQNIAVHYLDWYRFWKNEEGQSKRELCTGTIMFRNLDINKQLIIMWIEENKKKLGNWEQRNLQNVLEREKIYPFNLPVEYCAIKKRDGTLPSYIEKPVILHHQVSRISKNKC